MMVKLDSPLSWPYVERGGPDEDVSIPCFTSTGVILRGRQGFPWGWEGLPRPANIGVRPFKRHLLFCSVLLGAALESLGTLGISLSPSKVLLALRGLVSLSNFPPNAPQNASFLIPFIDFICSPFLSSTLPSSLPPDFDILHPR